jgi:predicted RNA-binding protein YlxR (DUF448 family)
LAKTRHVPERTCVACGQKRPKRGLTRIVRTPQGAVLVDLTGKDPGRGAYLCEALPCWEQGIHKGRLARGLHASITPADGELLMAYYRQHMAHVAGSA